MSKTLEEINKRVEAAAHLVSSAEADWLIGDGDENHKILVQGVQAEQQLLREVLVRNFDIKDLALFDAYLAKSQMLLLRMIHSSYAAGIQRERQNGRRKRH